MCRQGQLHRENHEIWQDPHQDVVGDDTTDTNADDLGNLLVSVSIHGILLQKEPGTDRRCLALVGVVGAGLDGDGLDLAQLGPDGLDLLLAALPFLLRQLHRVDHVVQIPDDAFEVLLDLLHMIHQ